MAFDGAGAEAEADVGLRLVRQVDVTATWLGGRPVDQFAPGKRLGDVAARVAEICQSMVDLQVALDPDGYADSTSERPPQIPTLSGHALGSQLRVVATELLSSMRDSPREAAREKSTTVLNHVVAELISLRSTA